LGPGLGEEMGLAEEGMEEEGDDDDDDVDNE
jgi:hypothetical protein